MGWMNEWIHIYIFIWMYLCGLLNMKTNWCRSKKKPKNKQKNRTKQQLKHAFNCSRGIFFRRNKKKDRAEILFFLLISLVKCEPVKILSRTKVKYIERSYWFDKKKQNENRHNKGKVFKSAEIRELIWF